MSRPAEYNDSVRSSTPSAPQTPAPSTSSTRAPTSQTPSGGGVSYPQMPGHPGVAAAPPPSLQATYSAGNIVVSPQTPAPSRAPLTPYGLVSEGAEAPAPRSSGPRGLLPQFSGSSVPADVQYTPSARYTPTPSAPQSQTPGDSSPYGQQNTNPAFQDGNYGGGVGSSPSGGGGGSGDGLSSPLAGGVIILGLLLLAGAASAALSSRR